MNILPRFNCVENCNSLSSRQVPAAILAGWTRTALAGVWIVALLASASVLTGCPDDPPEDTDPWSMINAATLADDYEEADYSWNGADVSYITLSGDSITENAAGASADGSVLTIFASGTYSITGTLTDGRIVIDTPSGDDGVVRLIFNGVNITCLTSAPFYVGGAERTAIILADGTNNILTDAATYTQFDVPADGEPNAALYSTDYLTIGTPAGGTGTGQLTVNGNYNDGITGKDGVIIGGGTITVNAEDDGIRGKDYLVVKDGDIDVTATDGVGFKSDKSGDATKGYVSIEDGLVHIVSAGDGIEAETYVLVYDGGLSVTSGGGAGSPIGGDSSQKGLKGGAGVLVGAGDLVIDSADDALHSNDFVEITGGTFDIFAADDGIHANSTVEIADGTIRMWQSFEGIESGVITIRDGSLYIVSADDGLNCAAASKEKGSAELQSKASSDYQLRIYGGYVAVYAQGDGFDSNGDIEMTGGRVVIHGPTNPANSILDSGDVDGAIYVDGGLLVGAGSAGTPESPSPSSDQRSKLLTFAQKAANTLFHIESSDGTDIVTFRPSKQYESIILSSPDLQTGKTYNVYFGGTYTGGTETDDLYEGGAYSGGTQDTSLTFSFTE